MADVPRRLGPDLLTIGPDRLVIHSRADMDGWEVRRHRKSLIHYDGRTWRVDRKLPSGRGAVRYELTPWTPGDLELTGPEIRYDEAYVREREAQRAVARRQNAVAPLMTLLSPLIGFLPSGVKLRIYEAYGVNPVTATQRSLFLEYLIIVMALVWTAIGLGVAGFGAFLGGTGGGLPARPSVLLALVLTPDAVMRWSRLLEEDSRPPGFYEWLWRRRTPAS